MKKDITLNAFAKINLILDVFPVRSDGYHELRSVMQTVSLCDKVTVSISRGFGINISCSDKNVPLGSKNTAFRAAEAFYEKTGLGADLKTDIYIEKSIPTQAGLAGGSADAAAVIKALNTLFEAESDNASLCKIGAQIGADVPFCITGGTALCEGIGEIITPLDALPDCTILIAKPDVSISTPDAYRLFDNIKNPVHSDFDAFVSALKKSDLKGVCAALSNSLESVCGSEEIFFIKNFMINHGALGSLMSGSGSSVFGIFDDSKTCSLCFEKLKEHVPFCKIVKPVKKI